MENLHKLRIKGNFLSDKEYPQENPTASIMISHEILTSLETRKHHLDEKGRRSLCGLPASGHAGSSRLWRLCGHIRRGESTPTIEGGADV